MKDVAKLVTEKTEQFLNENLDKIVEVKVSKLIDDVMQSLLTPYGALGKQLKEQLEAKLNINLSEVKIEAYNDMVNKIVEDGLKKYISEESLSIIKTRISETVSMLEKKEWKLSEIVEKFKECKASDEEDFTVDLHVSTRSTGNYSHIGIQIEKRGGAKRGNAHSHDYQIDLTEDGRCYGFKAHGLIGFVDDKITHTRRIWDDFAEFLFALYANRAVVTLDEDDCDLEYSKEEY